MGVSGSGKTSVGKLLAKELAVVFIDADDHHPPANIEKMSQGIPLVDTDREPWLDRIHEIAVDHIKDGCVIACSALKKVYRERLVQFIEPETVWIYLKGNYDLILERMNNREGHFMKAKMLKSQFEVLEEPKQAIDIDISDSPKSIVQKIIPQLK